MNKIKFSIIWIFIIITLILLPSKDLPSTNLKIKNLDKIVHFSLFGILAILNFWEVKKYNLKIKSHTLIISAFIFSFLTEISQLLFTTTRHFDLLDIIADNVGYISLYLIIFYLNKYKIFKIR